MTTKFIDIKIRSKSAEVKVKSLDGSMKRLGKTADKVTKSHHAMAGGFADADHQAGMLLHTVTAMAVIFATTKIVQLSDDFIGLQNAIRLTTNTTAELNERTEDLAGIATRSRTSLLETGRLFSNLTLATDNLGLSTVETLRITETISKSFAVTGATAAESAGAIRQLGQAFSAGALRGDEFNSISEQAPEIMRALQRETGKTSGELKAFAATGGITAELLVKALGNAANIIDEKLSKAVVTFSQNAQIATNIMTLMIGESTTLQDTISGTGLALIKAAENIETIAKFATLGAAVLATRMIPATIAYTQSTLSSVAAIGLQTKATIRVGAATTLTTASINRAVAANAALAISSRSIGAALTLVGGPLGAAALAATAIFLFVDAAETADEKSKRLSGTINDLKNSFLGLTEAQRVTEVSRINNEFKVLSAELVVTNDRLNSVRDTVQFKGKSAIVTGLEDDLQGINDQLDLLAIKRQAIFEGGLPSITGETIEAPTVDEGLDDKGQKKLDNAISFFEIERRLTERHLRNLFDLENNIATEAVINEENRFLTKVERLQSRFETELAALGANETAKQELRNSFNEAEQIAVTEHETILSGIKVSEEKKKTESETNAARTRLRLAGKAIGDFAGLSKKGQKIQRRLQQADIIASTAVSVVDSFRNAGGFPLGIPAAAAMAAAGAVQLKQLGGEGGGGSIASPTGAAGGLQQTPTATAQELPQQTRAIDIRIDDNALLTGAMFKEALNSVLESDSDIAINISNAQAEAVRTGAT